MKLNTKTFIFLFAALTFFIFSGGAVFAGFGVSPASLLNKNLVPGSFFEQDIYLVQSQPDIDLNVVVTIDAGKINDWIKIENGNNFIIPKGTQQFPMKVNVNVPSNAELGNYKGTITVNTSPAGAQKDGVSVTLGANIAINLDVTSIKVSDFSIQNFQIPDAVKGSPIKFVIKIKNDGNVDNGPTKVGLTFFDQYHSQQLGQQEVAITEKVKSFQTKDISVEFPNNLDIGSYWADVKLYNNEETIIDSKIVFAVVSPTDVKKEQEKFVFPDFSMIPLWAYLLAGAIVIILILVVTIILILRKNKNKNDEK
jgi:hypothetical protein